MSAVAWPRPFELLARLLVAAALVLWPAHVFQRALVTPLLPLLGDAVVTFDDSLRLISVDVVSEPSGEVVRFRVNLAHPVEVAGYTVYPFGWGSAPRGGYQVRLTLGGVLQYPAFVLIAILAWPAKRAAEYGLRLFAAVPLMAVLLLVDTPSTVLAEVWGEIHAGIDARGFQPLMVWSRFLMGGGGLVLALLCAALAVVPAAQWRNARSRRIARHRSASAGA